MPRINELPPDSSLIAGDQIPILSSVDQVTKNVTLAQLNAYLTTPTGPPSALLGVNLGGDQQSSQVYNPAENAIDFASLSTLMGTKKIRTSLPSWDSANGISNMRALVSAAKTAGFNPSYGITGNSGVQNATSYANWKAQVPTEAAWASSNGIATFFIGNEEDWQAQIGQFGTVTGPQVRTDVLALAVTLKALYPTMTIVYSSAQGTVTQWNAVGTGSLDKLGFNMYDTLTNFPNNLDYFMSQIGAKYFVSEWGSQHPYRDMITNYGYNDVSYANDLATRASQLISRNLESYFFAWRYSTNGDTVTDWNIRKADNTYKPGVAGIFGAGLPVTTYVRKDGDAMTGRLRVSNNGVFANVVDVTNPGVDVATAVTSDTTHGVFVNLNSGLPDYSIITGGGTDGGGTRFWALGGFGDQGLNAYIDTGTGRVRKFTIDLTGKTEVVGALKLTGAGTPGAGKVLKSDATGNATWGTASGTGDALVANPLSQFASTTSLQLKGVLSDATGTGAAVFANSPALVTPTGIVKNDVGLGNVDNTSDVTKNAATVTLTNKTLTAPIMTTPALGTPASGTMTNVTGLPISTGVSGLATGVATLLATPTSANLAAALTDETGTGAAVFATSPTLVTPLLGTPTSGVATNLTGLPLSTGVTGNLPVTNLNSGTSASATTYWRGDGTWATPAGGGSGQTIVTKTVAPAGGDYTTVSAALTAASSGWAIRVLPGTYTEAGVTGLVLSNVSVVADDPYATTLAFGANNMVVSGIANFTLMGVAVTFTTGYMNVSGAYSSITNCRITRTSSNNANTMTFNSQSLQVTGCFFSYQGASTAVAFMNIGSNFQTWSNNVWEIAPVYDNGGAQGTIRIASGYNTFSNNQFQTLSNATKNLISIEGGNTTFTGNNLTDGFGNTNCAKMIVVTSASNTITGNIINGGALGISVQGSGTDNVISGNNLNSTKVAILTSATTNARNAIVGNVLYGTGTAVTGSIGISATGNHCTIVGNCIQNHKDGAIIQTGATKNVAASNVILNNGTNFTDSGTSTTVSGANITV